MHGLLSSGWPLLPTRSRLGGRLVAARASSPRCGRAVSLPLFLERVEEEELWLLLLPLLE